MEVIKLIDIGLSLFSGVNKSLESKGLDPNQINPFTGNQGTEIWNLMPPVMVYNLLDSLFSGDSDYISSKIAGTLEMLGFETALGDRARLRAAQTEEAKRIYDELKRNTLNHKRNINLMWAAIILLSIFVIVIPSKK